MAKRYNTTPKFAEAAEDYIKTMYEAEHGVEPPGGPPKRSAPPYTRTSPESYCATNQRAPYQAVEDTSTPGLDEGVAFRQKL